MTVTLYTHPEYRRQVETWQTLCDLYQGDKDRMRETHYIPKFAVEEGADNVSKKIYAQRMARTFYTNLCEPIVWIWIGWLFQEAIKTDAIERIITPEEQANFDGQGTSFIDVVQDMARALILYGPTYAVIDTPSIQTTSKAEDDMFGKRPYGRVIEPLYVPDWRIKNVNHSSTGEYEQIDYIWRAVKPRMSGTDKPYEAWYRRSLYFEDNTVMSTIFIQPEDTLGDREEKRFNPYENETDWETLESEPLSDLDRLPIVRGGKKSWIQSSASNMLRRHQLESSFENILHHQAYAKVFISGAPLSESGVVFSEQSVNFLEQDSTVTVVNSENPAALDLRLKDVTDTIFKIAFNQIRSLPGTSQAVQSDRTIREERAPQFAAAKSAIDEFETLINGIVDVWANLKGIEPSPEERVSMSRDFTKEDFDEIEKRFNTYRDEINRNTTWRKAHLESIVDRESFDDETKAEIKERFNDNLPNTTDAIQNVRNQLVGAVASGRT